jgi:hypothetical protein
MLCSLKATSKLCHFHLQTNGRESEITTPYYWHKSLKKKHTEHLISEVKQQDLLDLADVLR